MKTISVHEAKAKLSGLISAVERGESRVVLSRYGKPVAEIVPFRKPKRSTCDPSLAPIRCSGDLTASTEEEWTDVGPTLS